MAQPKLPEGVFSFLDTDLYKLTMQCAVLKYFPTVDVEYKFTNRTPQMRLSKRAFAWLEEQIAKLANIRLSQQELEFLRRHCTYLSSDYLDYMQVFQLRPTEQVQVKFAPVDDTYGDLDITVTGSWVETILYEIPLLALTSEAYFKFVDKDWDHEGQEENAYQKGVRLLSAGCLVSEFGTRRRRDFHAQDLVIKGLVRASQETDLPGKLTGTSNVYFAMKHNIAPVGTVAHEWYMGIAALTNDYEHANEQGLRYWLDCFGKGVLGIALTDTFGTDDFFKAFKKQIPAKTSASKDPTMSYTDESSPSADQPSYAEVFAGIRQDSGDPKEYVKQASEFYKSIGLSGKNIVFSDALNVDKCLEYKKVAEDNGFKPSFGVGTFFTNDFSLKSDPQVKSKPLNIVVKLSKAGGRPAVKISDNIGKNTGDTATVQDVKRRLGYIEHEWKGGDEAKRW
ncbi:nicotinate phosphoribosyltransferase [Elasticomyces elasticus]|uniref:Nicotinate phosphoribosyltransferase n=1 Tax=Exophiala sideris TaxID=1016849 RepID=A0ABR0J5R5_9EURO|nr:nicotinate phosphoribosyltransferase [Elasticomyces elasticus]KAK5026942.1 nicotinate phosphoribosyltransferase [Exophiala sideris]KAK5033946.1 nicotinate phosphoribosyltransferase [Exophiala sideris]KAK5055779.1 nicotinate phosphoribosyltransferase [Exophiala sideris]KAK5180888.1 nicotinate phosphoribosyltransferase [Eurotiomycetes sp. CCFEE 6388]